MSGVRVNECKVFATTQGADWWAWFRIHHERVGRITPVVVSMGGDLVDVACDDSEHAEWLAGEMVRNGIHKSAVQVLR